MGARKRRQAGREVVEGELVAVREAAEQTALVVVRRACRDLPVFLDYAGPDLNPVHAYLNSLSPLSAHTMASALESILRLAPNLTQDLYRFPWASLRVQHVQAIRAALANSGLAYTTVNLRLAALKGVLFQAHLLDYISPEDWARIKAVKLVRGQRLPAGRALVAREKTLLLNAATQGASPALAARDQALLAVALGCGPRRSEIVALDISDWNREAGTLLVRSGKGNKDRELFVPEADIPLVEAWLSVRGAAAGPLFPPVSKSGRVLDRRLTAQGYAEILEALSKRADVTHFGSHSLRRTFVSDALDRTGDISTVSALAGHANIQTTRRYDVRGDVAKRKVANSVAVSVIEAVG
jgi:integrase